MIWDRPAVDVMRLGFLQSSIYDNGECRMVLNAFTLEQPLLSHNSFLMHAVPRFYLIHTNTSGLVYYNV